MKVLAKPFMLKSLTTLSIHRNIRILCFTYPPENKNKISNPCISIYLEYWKR